MASGKHSSNQGFDFDFDIIPWKKILLFLFTLIIAIIAFFGGKFAYSSFVADKKISKEIKEEPQEEIVIEEKIPIEISGFKVLGELKIDNKNYSQYILEYENDSEKSTDNIETEDTNTEEVEATSENDDNSELVEALKNGLVKLYGNTINQKGNFTIIGHNEEKYFSILNELKVGDYFSIKNTNNEKKYIITEIYNVEPTDLKPLMPNNNYTEVSLITCTTGSNERLVVKALEEKDYNLSKETNVESDDSIIE